jgi:hypothetical protein
VELRTATIPMPYSRALSIAVCIARLATTIPIP